MTETEDASNSAGGTPRSDVNPTLGVDTDQAPEAPETIRTLTETSSFKPKKPKFGGLSQVGPDSYAAWTGGKPKADWTELEDPNPADIQPNQFRATSVSTQAKSQAYRRRGLENLFSKEHDVLLFQNDVMNHLEDYGMDTITYIQDPVDGKTLISIVDHYGKFTRETGSEKGDDNKLVHYDSYDLKNVVDAKKFIYNSVDDHLKKQLNENCSKDCSFITYWLELIHCIQSTSLEKYEVIKSRIKSIKASDYEGENVETMCSDFYNLFTTLDNSAMYDQI